MKNVIELLQGVLLEENETVTFINEDNNYYYFNVNNEDEYDFNGVARVEKANKGNMYNVEFKQNSENVYRGEGMLELA